MNMNMNTCFHEVYNALGSGLNVDIYHRAIEVYLRMHKIPYESQKIVPIVFCEHTVGNIQIDLIVNGDTIVEIKTDKLDIIKVGAHLKLVGVKQAYLVNFQQKEPEIKIINL